MAAKKPKVAKEVALTIAVNSEPAIEVVKEAINELDETLDLKIVVVGILDDLVDAGENGAYVDDEFMEYWHDEENPLVELSGIVVDGYRQARATQAGFDLVMSKRIKPVTTEGKKMSKIEIENVPVSAVRGRGRKAGSSAYPFDALEVGQSFFIANTEGNEGENDKVKSLASSVSAATRRYSVPVEGETVLNRNGEAVQKMHKTRVFVIRADSKDGVSGARIGRIA